MSDNVSTNGASRYQSEKVRVAIVGVGNCASAFVQGVEYYKNADPNEDVPGLMHVDLGGYHVRDIEFTAAFDIDSDKVGKDLSEAIWSGQNNTIKFAEVPNLDVPVHPLALIVRPLVPVQPQPLQPFEDAPGVGVGGALLVGVLDAQEEGAAVLAGPQPVEERGARPAYVQVAGGAGGEADPQAVLHRARSRTTS